MHVSQLLTDGSIHAHSLEDAPQILLAMASWLRSSTPSHFCSTEYQDLRELTGRAAERAAELCLARGYRLSISGPGMDSDR